MPDTPPRRNLGRYELVELLGKGGMGEVWLAKITGAAGFEKPCIVKTVLPELAGDPSFVDRFLHEAKVLVHLVHSNIAQVYDMGEDAGVFFMALEYIGGVDLAELGAKVSASGQPLPVRVALYLGQRVADGLAYAHRKADPEGKPLCVVHRDVSPHNAMVSYEGEVKLIDFGLAKSAARSRLTQEAVVMGKLGYMSPEQARAEPLDARSDIYSCGVVLWELLAGRPLVERGPMGQMLVAMVNPKVPSLASIRPDVSPALEAIVMKALAPDPTQRTQRAEELSLALAGHLAALGPPVAAEEVGAFVRAQCHEAFTAQQRLLSRLSTLNAPLKLGQPVAVIEAVRLDRAAETQSLARTVTSPRPGFDSRPTSPLSPRSTPATVAPTDPGVAGVARPSEASLAADLAAVRKPRAPLFAAVIVLGVVAGVGAGLLFGGKHAPPAEAANGGPPLAVPEKTSPTAVAPALTPPADLTGHALADPPGADAAPALPTPPIPTGPEGATAALAAEPPEARPEPMVAPAPLGGAEPGPSGTAHRTATRKQGLKGAVLVTTGPSPSVTVVNQDDRTWTRCQVTLPDYRVQRMPTLNPGFRRELALNHFQEDRSAAPVSHAVLVKCAEGQARFPAAL